MNIKNLEKCFYDASKLDKKYIGVKIQMQQFEEPQIIIDSNSSFDSRFSYYKKVFGEDLKSEQGNKIIGFTFGNSFGEIEKDLIKIPTSEEIDNKEMVSPKSWKEFRDNGLLWWINMILHTLGWSIVVNVKKDGTITNVYPARVRFRGFTNEFNTEGYIKVSEYLNKESTKLLKESKE